jgi:catechol 2,3-dioxygenase-like lactoylglutathione lyase family enzyme
VFLGIDHTAIAIGDTTASLAFYRDRLGFRLTGESENDGPEQERLNAVRGAQLRITSLRAADGPGVELLEYLTPRDGRSFPADERANDLVHWQTRLVARDGATLDALAPARVVTIVGHELGFARGLTVRDPDGHTVEVVEP